MGYKFLLHGKPFFVVRETAVFLDSNESVCSADGSYLPTFVSHVLCAESIFALMEKEHFPALDIIDDNFIPNLRLQRLYCLKNHLFLHKITSLLLQWAPFPIGQKFLLIEPTIPSCFGFFPVDPFSGNVLDIRTRFAFVCIAVANNHRGSFANSNGIPSCLPFDTNEIQFAVISQFEEIPPEPFQVYKKRFAFFELAFGDFLDLFDIEFHVCRRILLDSSQEENACSTPFCVLQFRVLHSLECSDY